MKPDYKDPYVTPGANPDKVAIHKKQISNIHEVLDKNITRGWTLVFYDDFTNAIVITNGGSDVSELDYSITKLIQSARVILFAAMEMCICMRVWLVTTYKAVATSVGILKGKW